MNIADFIPSPPWADVGAKMYQFISDLYPICRSITGNGVRETLRYLQAYVPLNVCEVPTGTQVFDWVIPKEWNIRDAYIKDSKGEKVVDFRRSPLHVVSNSIPIKKKLSLEKLKNHLFTLPLHPKWIPYRTSYYKENWGFCLSHEQMLKLNDSEYEVWIDASLEPGHLTYGEYYQKGQESDEILISTHVCHPSLCNDNLSGIALATALAAYIRQISPRYSYRFLFIPSTIGAITWLSLNESHVAKIKHGLVVACAGDSGKPSYKKTRQGNTEIDKVMLHVLRSSGQKHEILDFSPYGYDERHFCSPAFNLPVGCFMRTPHGQFSEYHTSADNLDFVQPAYLADSFQKCLTALYVLENNKIYINQNPKCEPQLGKRGLYRGYPQGGVDDLSILWVLNLSDGNHTLLDIAERSGIAFDVVKRAADALLSCNLLIESDE